jgi:hypothetical protein
MRQDKHVEEREGRAGGEGSHGQELLGSVPVVGMQMRGHDRGKDYRPFRKKVPIHTNVAHGYPGNRPGDRWSDPHALLSNQHQSPVH